MKNVKKVANACVVVACGVVLGALTAGNVIVALAALSAQIVFALLSFSISACSCKKSAESESKQLNVKVEHIFLPQVKPVAVKVGFTCEDLVSFGNYLLSPERAATIEKEELKSLVGDWDIRNWLDKKVESKKKEPAETKCDCGNCAQKDE